MAKFLNLIFVISNLLHLAFSDSLSPQKTEVSATEGDSVTLDCSYSTSITDPYLYWYRQYPQQAPELILYKRRSWDSSSTYKADFARSRFTTIVTDKSTTLTITTLSLSDTGVYFCALSSTVHNIKKHLSSFIVKMMVIYLILVLMCDASFGDSVHPLSNEVYSEDGQAVTLMCNYSTSTTATHYLFWYRQSPNGNPEYLIHTDSYQGTKRTEGYGILVDKDTKQVQLNISKLDVAESATYYCALSPTVF
ncbi:uncharacterized protein [Lepisosteus oculatus]|uniref:uncharacterized protein n=1 Tax=Lepisosteus oculatus TaxID=7918 RepID=UPI003716B44A